MKSFLKIVLLTVLFLLFFVPQTVLAFQAYIPHITGGTWADYLTADNNKATKLSFQLYLYGNGKQVYSNTFTVNAMSERMIEIKKLSSKAEIGLIKYEDSMLNFRLSYESLDGGGVAEFQLTGNRSQILGFYFSDMVEAISWKGIAIANLNSSSASATLYALGGGKVLGTKKITIGAYDKEIGDHTIWFPSIKFDTIKKIIVVSSSNLCGITISGDATSSLLLFTSAAELTEFSAGGDTGGELTGTWKGKWYSTPYSGSSGNITINITQTGTRFTGTMSVTNTDCGNVSGVTVEGTVVDNLVTINASFNCYGDIATLVMTSATLSGSTMNGNYNELVNGFPYDYGTFTLTKN